MKHICLFEQPFGRRESAVVDLGSKRMFIFPADTRIGDQELVVAALDYMVTSIDVMENEEVAVEISTVEVRSVDGKADKLEVLTAACKMYSNSVIFLWSQGGNDV